MTEEELTNWEHRPDVIRVLTSYEMGAWLHRRDKRLLQEIGAEILSKFENSTEPNNIDAMMRNIGREECLDIIDKYREDGD